MMVRVIIFLASLAIAFPAAAQETAESEALVATERAVEKHAGTHEGTDAGAMAHPEEAGHGEGGGEEHGHAAPHIEDQNWSFEGPFGTYDRAALQRGFEVYRQVCAACHSLDRLYYRNLTAIGYSEDQVKAIAADYLVTDGPDDEGEMFERPAIPSDRFKAPFANRQAAAFANNGAYPPDMSLLAKARHGGADYIYALLTGYEDPPPGRDLLPGQNWNAAMPGHLLAMAPPLADGMVAYEDGTEGTMDQYARDVAQFLAWASEPHLEERKRTGIKAFLFLLVFTFIMYGVKKRIWRDAH